MVCIINYKEDQETPKKEAINIQSRKDAAAPL